MHYLRGSNASNYTLYDDFAYVEVNYTGYNTTLHNETFLDGVFVWIFSWFI
jgi:hypothetical protein